MAGHPKIVYYVGISLDGYISGPDEDISLFVAESKGIDQYLMDLKSFKTVIMGRKTYEFGYDFGLAPGQPAYPHMEHHIFSTSLKFDSAHPQVHVEPLEISRVKEIRDNSPTDVYLCGGGEFAGWLLDHNLIDQLIVKINPIVLGGGVSLFGSSQYSGKLDLVESTLYDHGLQICTYDIRR